MESIEMQELPAPDAPPKSALEATPKQPTEVNKDVTSLGFWSTHVRITIEEEASRDHLALERTFLAYCRTASAYAQFGVTMAQLFRLNVSENGFQTPLTLKIGKALGATTEAIAVAIMLIGAVYFMKQQHGLLRGVIVSRGLDVLFMATVSFALFSILLGLLAAANKW